MNDTLLKVLLVIGFGLVAFVTIRFAANKLENRKDDE